MSGQHGSTSKEWASDFDVLTGCRPPSFLTTCSSNFTI